MYEYVITFPKITIKISRGVRSVFHTQKPCGPPRSWWCRMNVLFHAGFPRDVIVTRNGQ